MKSKKFIQEDWERISDHKLIFRVEKEEEEWREFWSWYCSQEGDIVVLSQLETVEELPF